MGSVNLIVLAEPAGQILYGTGTGVDSSPDLTVDAAGLLLHSQTYNNNGVDGWSPTTVLGGLGPYDPTAGGMNVFGVSDGTVPALNLYLDISGVQGTKPALYMTTGECGTAGIPFPMFGIVADFNDNTGAPWASYLFTVVDHLFEGNRETVGFVGINTLVSGPTAVLHVVNALTQLSVAPKDYVVTKIEGRADQVANLMEMKLTGGSNVFTVSPTGLATFADDIVMADGQAFGPTTTTAQTALLRAYDVDGAAYLTFATLTNGNTPSFTLQAPAGGTLNLGTPTTVTLTNATGLPVSTGVSGLGANVATFLGTPSSANLIAAVSDETGTGALVFANTPSLVTPALGAATYTSLAGGVITLTSTSATAFESGPNGATNPTLRLVQNVASAVTGLSITGNASGSGVTLTALGGTNETIFITPKGTGKVIDSRTIGSAGSVTWYLENLSSGGAASFQLYNSGGEGLVAIIGSSAYGSTIAGITRNRLSVIRTDATNGLMLGTNTGAPLYFITNTAVVGSFLSGGGFTQVGYHEMTEMTAPAAPATNSARFFLEDNGAGKTRFMVQFATGVAQQLAIEA